MKDQINVNPDAIIQRQAQLIGELQTKVFILELGIQQIREEQSAATDADKTD